MAQSFDEDAYFAQSLPKRSNLLIEFAHVLLALCVRLRELFLPQRRLPELGLPQYQTRHPRGLTPEAEHKEHMNNIDNGPSQEPREPRDLEKERVEAAVADILRRRREAGDYGPRRQSSFDEQETETLPERDPHVAVALYETMVTNGSDEERGAIAPRIDLLLPADRQTTIGLWCQLIEDRDQTISDVAYESLMMARADGRISEEEEAPLAEAYRRASETRSVEPLPGDEVLEADWQKFRRWHTEEDERDRCAAKREEQSDDSKEGLG